MKISYDKEVDALYIKLLEGDYQCRTLRLSDDILLNLGLNEELVGIEILSATMVMGKGQMPSIILEHIPADWKFDMAA